MIYLIIGQLLAFIFGVAFGLRFGPEIARRLRRLTSGYPAGVLQAAHQEMNLVRARIPEEWICILVLTEPGLKATAVAYNATSSASVAEAFRALSEDPAWQVPVDASHTDGTP